MEAFRNLCGISFIRNPRYFKDFNLKKFAAEHCKDIAGTSAIQRSSGEGGTNGQDSGGEEEGENNEDEA